MNAQKHTGQLILQAVPEGKAKTAVIAYLRKLFNNAPQEKIVALIQKSPGVLSKNVPAKTAQKVIIDLKHLGATAVYVPHTSTQPHASQKKQPPQSSQKKPPPQSNQKKPSAQSPRKKSQPKASQKKTSPKPSPNKKPVRKSLPADLKQPILQAFQGDILRVRVSFFYRVGLLLIALAMLLLPLIYVGLIGSSGYLMYWHITQNTDWFNTIRSPRMALLAYAAPVVGGVLLILFMIKPLFVKQAQPFKPRKLYPQDEPLLFAFVEKICEVVGAPMPTEIHVAMDVNAFASFRHGIWSMWGNDLVLTLGLPLIAGLNLTQLAGAIAHEFGHFAQTTGMRLSYLIRAINFWLVRVVYEEDEWDYRIRLWSQQDNGWITIILLLARLFIWIIRQILKIFMFIGHI